METNKDRSLSRRVQSLSRFLLEALNKEAAAAGRPSPMEPIYAVPQRQRTQCLSRPQRPEQVGSVCRILRWGWEGAEDLMVGLVLEWLRLQGLGLSGGRGGGGCVGGCGGLGSASAAPV